MHNFFLLVTGSNNQATVSEPLLGRYKLVKFVCNNGFYNINNNNNLFKLEHFDGITTNQYSLVISEGFYDGPTLFTLIDNALKSVTTGWSNSYDSTTHKMYFFLSNGSQTFQFLMSETPELAIVLGFDSVDTGLNTTLESTYPLDLNPMKMMYMRVSESNDRVFGDKHFSSTCWLHDESTSFGGVFQHTHDTDQCQLLKFNTTSSLDFKFYDKNYNPLTIPSFSLLLLKI